jgi:hypothetical protein
VVLSLNSALPSCSLTYSALPSYSFSYFFSAFTSYSSTLPIHPFSYSSSILPSHSLTLLLLISPSYLLFLLLSLNPPSFSSYSFSVLTTYSSAPPTTSFFFFSRLSLLTLPCTFSSAFASSSFSYSFSALPSYSSLYSFLSLHYLLFRRPSLLTLSSAFTTYSRSGSKRFLSHPTLHPPVTRCRLWPAVVPTVLLVG